MKESAEREALLVLRAQSGDREAPDARLRESVAGLSPASRAVVVLYYLHEMSLEETAAVLGVSPTQ